MTKIKHIALTTQDPDIPLHDLQPMPIELPRQLCQVFAFACAEIVQHTDMLAVLEQGLDDMGTDKPGAAVHKKFHLTSRSFEELCRSCVI